MRSDLHAVHLRDHRPLTPVLRRIVAGHAGAPKGGRSRRCRARPRPFPRDARVRLPQRRHGSQGQDPSAHFAPPAKSSSTDLVHVADQVEHDRVGLRIQPHRWLVEDQEAWIQHERASEFNDLLLASGKYCDALVAALGNHWKRFADVRHPAASSLDPTACTHRCARSPRRSSWERDCAPGAPERCRGEGSREDSVR